MSVPLGSKIDCTPTIILLSADLLLLPILRTCCLGSQCLSTWIKKNSKEFQDKFSWPCAERWFIMRIRASGLKVKAVYSVSLTIINGVVYIWHTLIKVTGLKVGANFKVQFTVLSLQLCTFLEIISLKVPSFHEFNSSSYV